MECDMELDGMHYEGTCIRPPSEAFSILLQVTLGCSHNKCTFCGTYKGKRFTIKDDRIILSDILCKIFDALEWIAAMSSHVPNKGEQMVRYYGYYSNVCRGKRKKQNQDGLVPCVLKPEEESKSYPKNWARLIQKIGACPGLDPGRQIPLSVPKIIKKILKHLGLWQVKPRPPPKPTGQTKIAGYSMDCSVSQLPGSDKSLYVDPVYTEILPS